MHICKLTHIHTCAHAYTRTRAFRHDKKRPYVNLFILYTSALGANAQLTIASASGQQVVDVGAFLSMDMTGMVCYLCVLACLLRACMRAGVRVGVCVCMYGMFVRNAWVCMCLYICMCISLRYACVYAWAFSLS